MLDRNTAADVLNEAVRTGGDFAELFVEDRVNHNMTLRSGRLESVRTGRLHGAGIRVFDGLRAIYVYTNDVTREGLLTCAGQAAAAVAGKAGCKPVGFSPWSAVREDEVRLMPGDTPAARKAEKLRAADAEARKASAEIVQVNCDYLDHVQNILVCNTDGVFAEDRRVRTRFSVSAVASDGRENQVGSQNPGASMGFEIFDSRIDPEQCARDAAATAVTMLHAEACPAGVFPVVIDNGFGGVIFHEACGHSLEATSVAYGLSEFSGKLGQQIAAPCVTAIDDGTIPNYWGSENIDDEGTPTTRLVLIENGILKNYMIDRLNARRMNMPVTGSGRRQDYTFAPVSRMRNTYIAAGTDDEEEIISSLAEGLYAKQMGGGSVNPLTGEFNFAVSEGYLIKNGKIDRPVRGATLIGKGGQTIMKIDRVGKKMWMAQGMCGASSGSVPTNVGQPMIRVTDMTVGGRK